MFELVALRSFVAVAEARSIGRAAARLGVGQPALSRRIQDLEDQVGVTLFERHPRGVRLTTAGEAFLGDARRLLDEAERVLERAGRFGRAELGALAIGLFPPAADGPLHGLIAGFRAAAPGVTVTCVEAACEELFGCLEAGRLDAVFAAADPPDVPERFAALGLWTERLVAALPAGHPLEERTGLGWADLDAEPLVLRSWEVTRPVQALLARRRSGRRRPAATEHRVGRDSLLALVAAGYGVTIVPEAAAALAWPGVAFVPIAEPDAVVPVSLAWRPDDGNPVLRRFLSHVRRHRREVGRAAPAPPAPVRSPSRSR